jgi:predicted nucleic-acid-binding protein
MIGLDTNVLVRYVAQDEPRQSLKATRLIETLTPEAPGFVGIVALIELVWVMTSCYGSTREDLSEILEAIFRAKELVIDRADTVWKALRRFREGKADFADCVIECTGSDAGCEHTFTFDREAAKWCGMRFIE